jgi:hypothetical protein
MADDTEEEWAWLIRDVWTGEKSALELMQYLTRTTVRSGFSKTD